MDIYIYAKLYDSAKAQSRRGKEHETQRKKKSHKYGKKYGQQCEIGKDEGKGEKTAE